MLRPYTRALIYNGAMTRLPLFILCSFFLGMTATLLHAQAQAQAHAQTQTPTQTPTKVPTQAPAQRSKQATPLRIAVAANFRAAAALLVADFERATGIASTVTSASTGVLAAQMRRGAPFDLLLAADQERPMALASDGFGLGPARCYALGSLVLLGADSLDGAFTVLARPGTRIAIANPRSAPYGRAAMRVLSGGTDSKIASAQIDRKQIVMGSNVQQALQFYRSGAAELALVARSLSPDEGIPIPPAEHASIAQFALVSAASRQPEAATALLEFILGAKTALADFGYRACS